MNLNSKTADLEWPRNGDLVFGIRLNHLAQKEGPQIKEASEERWAGSGIVGPNQMWTYIVFNEKSEFRQYMFECPVEENHVRIISRQYEKNDA